LVHKGGALAVEKTGSCVALIPSRELLLVPLPWRGITLRWFADSHGSGRHASFARRPRAFGPQGVCPCLGENRSLHCFLLFLGARPRTLAAEDDHPCTAWLAAFGSRRRVLAVERGGPCSGGRGSCDCMETTLGLYETHRPRGPGVPSSVTAPVVELDDGGRPRRRWGPSRATAPVVEVDDGRRRTGRWALSGRTEGAVRLDGDRGHAGRRGWSSLTVPAVRLDAAPRRP
jgi:hypothetical protein